MAVLGGNPTDKGGIVGRTKTIERIEAEPQILKAKITEVNDEIFEPTGSNTSTAFMITSASSVESINNFSANLVGGGSIDGQGLTIGEVYPIALNYVSASTHIKIDLFK
jgi:hypothetical protein|tara:strand:- start:398 stop:724 length:327 start_codon:yes stop_codon:yes gene_type:complete